MNTIGLKSRLLIQAASKTPGVINNNPKPYVVLKGFGNFAAVYQLRAYTEQGAYTEQVNDYFRIQSDIRENIYDTFVQKHIDLTTPDIVYFNTKKMMRVKEVHLMKAIFLILIDSSSSDVLCVSLKRIAIIIVTTMFIG
jgi:small-conductance mechanosensitive channel